MARLRPGNVLCYGPRHLGGAASEAWHINNAGQVVGDAVTVGGKQHAFFYNGGSLVDLGTLGGADSTAHGINNVGQIVGASATAGGDEHAFLFSGGTMSDLGLSRHMKSVPWALSAGTAFKSTGGNT